MLARDGERADVAEHVPHDDRLITDDPGSCPGGTFMTSPGPNSAVWPSSISTWKRPCTSN
jgi:hypothetical protein